jgi:hypothetical protein
MTSISNKGVLETESRTGTWLVSPGQRPEKIFFDPSVVGVCNQYLGRLMNIKVQKNGHKMVDLSLSFMITHKLGLR